MVPVEGMKYIHPSDERIQIKFPPNSVTKTVQIEIKVYPANTSNIIRTVDVNEIAKISNCLFGSHLDFQVPVSIELPLKWMDGWDQAEELDDLLFRVNDDWSIEIVDEVEVEGNIAKFTVSSLNGSCFAWKKALKQKIKDINTYSPVQLLEEVGCVSTARNVDQHRLGQKVQRTFAATHMAETYCKILFFVKKPQDPKSLMIMLECVKCEKVRDVIRKRKESYHFDVVGEWTSKDICMIPDKTIIKVDVRGKFSMPRGIQCKSPAISFNPNVNENFTIFQVQVSARFGSSLYGILSMRNTKGVIYEISFDPITYFHHRSNRRN